MKLFNGLVGLLSAWFAYKIARKLELKFAWLTIGFVIFAPLYFVKLFSGYTEPLFGFSLVLSVYLIVIRRPVLAALIISFLPFIRSEGYIILGVFAAYFLVRKKFKAFFFLATGQVIYSIVGLVVGKSLFWTLNEIPYHIVSPYGKGTFSHYPNQLVLNLGVPIFILVCLGMLILILDLMRVKIWKPNPFRLEVYLLIFGSFLTYFLFHTLSWGLGLFGSMGLNRVLVAMVPLLAVIALIGFDFVLNWESKGKFPYHTLITVPFVIYVLVFPFLHNPASINWVKELHRTPEMNLMQNIAADLKKNHPDRFLYYSNPYLSYALQINPFDKSKHLCFTDWQGEKKLSPNSLIIWDNWFSVTEERTDSLSLYQNPGLRLFGRYETYDTEPKAVFLVFGN
jgi:hypothetical protein